MNKQDLLANWLTFEVLEAMNDAKSRMTDLNPTDKNYQMWLTRYLDYRAELLRRNAYIARSEN
jgi:hypothetical protein